MTEHANHNEISAVTDDGIRFSLFAPRMHHVAIQGSWNDFKSVPLSQSSAGIWWVSFPLNDGEYRYRFEITQQEGKPPIHVADPTGMRFTEGSYEYSVIEIVNGQPIYMRHDWQHDEAYLTPNEQLIIYEMHIGDFRGGNGDDNNTPGTFARVLEKLDYLTDLGITALELMPVTQAQFDDNWGYSQYSLYAIDHTLGSPDELAQLVDECHKRGIRVIYDGVYNHLHEDAILPQIDYTYWFYEVNPDKPELHFGPKFNYEFHDEKLDVYPAREHALGSIHRWIGTFHMDAIRFDSTRALKHFDVIKWLDEQARKRAGFKPFYTIAEHLPEDPAITGTRGPVDAAWHDSFYRQLNCTTLGIPYDDRDPFNTTDLLRLMDAKNEGYESNYNIINHLSNHDHERTMFLLQSKSGLSEEAQFRRNKLGASLLLTAPGIPMLWMGEEFGQANERGEHVEQKPLEWSLLNRDQNRDLWQHYKRLIHLRKENTALCSDNFEVIADMSERGVIAFKRWNNEGQVIVVAANLKDQHAGKVELALAGIDDCKWRELLHDYEIEVKRNCLVDELGESEVKIYLKC
jgi:1,4-alpha-glucan branching enzyme